jgi:hypothetical protein
MFIFLPLVMAQNHAPSVFAVSLTLTMKLALDIAVREYGLSCVELPVEIQQNETFSPVQV